MFTQTFWMRVHRRMRPVRVSMDARAPTLYRVTRTKRGPLSSTDSAAARTDPLVRGGMLLIALLLIAANLRAAITPVGPLIGDIRSDLGISAVTASVLISPLGLLWTSLIGLGSGGSIVLALALLGLRTHHHGQSASLCGMAQSMGYLLAATGPIVISILHDATDAWVLPLVVLLCVVAAQVVFGVLGGRDRQLGMRPSDR